MAKITVETPSEAVVKAANEIITVADARGRQIGVRKIGALDRMRLFECAGAENSKNEPYMGYAALAYSVASIDGEPVAKPTKLMHLEALVQRLDDDGLNAVAQHFASLAEDSQDAEALLKNAPGTPTSAAG